MFGNTLRYTSCCASPFPIASRQGHSPYAEPSDPISRAEYRVLDRFRIGGRTYLAVAKIGTSGRRAFQVFDPHAQQMRALHILPDSTGSFDRVRTLQRLTQGDNEILQILECHQYVSHSPHRPNESVFFFDSGLPLSADPIVAFSPFDSCAATPFPAPPFEDPQRLLWAVLFDVRGESGTIAEEDHAIHYNWRD